MRCPYCGGLDTQVKDSRPTEDSSSIRRRRVCPDCGGRFTTFERVQLRELMVVKRNGRRVPFDRDKLERSVEVALRKRAVAPERVERMINGIVRQLESQGDADIPTERIGELVMEGLKGLDDVAYVRFASVYRNFREARDFNAIVGELAGAPEGEPAAGRRDRRGRARRRDDRAGRGRRTLDGRGAALRPPQLRPDGAQPLRRGADRQGWRLVGRGVTAPGGRPHAEVAGDRRSGRGGARRNDVRDARAVLASRRRRRPAPRRSSPPGWRAWSRRSKIPTCGSPAAASRGCATAGIAVDGRRRRRAQARRDHRGHILRVDRRPADGDAEARADRRRLRRRRRARRAPGDHRRSGQSAPCR